MTDRTGGRTTVGGANAGKRRTLVFNTERYAYMADDVRRLCGFDAGQVERNEFPDGEHYRRILTCVEACDVVLLGLSLIHI